MGILENAWKKNHQFEGEKKYENTIMDGIEISRRRKTGYIQNQC